MSSLSKEFHYFYKMQISIYHKLKNKTVRDLYWLLFSDTPLSDDYDLSPFQLFPKDILNEWQMDSTEYFLALDNHPNDIENFVNRKKNKRLGFYAEALLSYFFQTFNKVELLLQNFQIIENQKTIGEVDFIIRYNRKVIHLECAIKYYLLKESHNTSGPSQWVGPRLKDNLELKINKLIQHQLPLGLRKEIYENINCLIDSSYLFLKGIFFAEEKTEPGKINRNQPNGLIRQSELKAVKEKAIEELSRPNWLSATNPNGLKRKKEFIELDNLEDSDTPLLGLFLFNDGKTKFIVPDDWGKE